jgi:hypothetical protein
MLDDARAWELLDELVAEPGTLRIITSLPDPGAPTADPRDPAYNVCYDVISIEPNGDALIARSAEGALCIGRPLDLLIRLTEWDYWDPEEPAGTRDRVLAALEARA